MATQCSCHIAISCSCRVKKKAKEEHVTCSEDEGEGLPDEREGRVLVPHRVRGSVQTIARRVRGSVHNIAHRVRRSVRTIAHRVRCVRSVHSTLRMCNVSTRIARHRKIQPYSTSVPDMA
eukprot:2818918-Rhodomonas_salina.2